MADAVAEDGLGDDGLLVHDGLDHLGDVRGGDLEVIIIIFVIISNLISLSLEKKQQLTGRSTGTVYG